MLLIPFSPVRPTRRWGFCLVGVLLIGLAGGCATIPAGKTDDTYRSLRRTPEVPDGYRRADQALVAAFFTANGSPLLPRQVEAIIGPADPQGRISRSAIRRMARKNDRLVVVLNADETFLWDMLDRNLPLLVLLPPDIRYSPVATPYIPVAWDREEQTLDLLDGNGEIRTLSEAEFFGRREPLKQAAICLIKPSGFRHFEPTRKQKLLLADFWYDKGFYRRAEATYSGIQEVSVTGTDVAALIGQGNILVRKKKYTAAIPVFRAALALEPDNPRILNNLAYTMLRGDGEMLVALRHASKAATLDPHNPLVLETLGSINLRVGDATAAAKYLEHAWARALKRSPEVQIAIMDQLVRAWLAADREDLAWQVAEYRYHTYPEYRMPKDILESLPSLKRARRKKK
jgi:tetratricopeptide (TPR) repeat protein